MGQGKDSGVGEGKGRGVSSGKPILWWKIRCYCNWTELGGWLVRDVKMKEV